jgi:hypothetical protein
LTSKPKIPQGFHKDENRHCEAALFAYLLTPALPAGEVPHDQARANATQSHHQLASRLPKQSLSESNDCFDAGKNTGVLQ